MCADKAALHDGAAASGIELWGEPVGVTFARPLRRHARRLSDAWRPQTRTVTQPRRLGRPGASAVGHGLARGRAVRENSPPSGLLAHLDLRQALADAQRQIGAAHQLVWWQPTRRGCQAFGIAVEPRE